MKKKHSNTEIQIQRKKNRQADSQREKIDNDRLMYRICVEQPEKKKALNNDLRREERSGLKRKQDRSSLNVSASMEGK